jgi:spore germination protein GerM
MGKKQSKAKSFGVLVVLALVVFVIAAAVTFYFAGNRGEKKPPRITVTRPPVVTLVSERRNITVFVPEGNGDKVYLVPIKVKALVKDSKLDMAMQALIAAGTKGGKAPDLIPEGTKLLSPVKVDKGIATVNFNGQFIENFNGGSDQEALTLNAIIHTLVYNSDGEVKKARIFVEGKAAESLGGHFELTDPIEADSTLLKPGNK